MESLLVACIGKEPPSGWMGMKLEKRDGEGVLWSSNCRGNGVVGRII
jgi:hypothetical protein